MTDLVVLKSKGSSHSLHLPLAAAEVLDDSETLLERVRDCPGSIAWVAIAPDVNDATDVVSRIRDADPSVNLVVLGPNGRGAEDLSRILGGTDRETLEAEKLASINALTAGIAHDIGTPMTAILGYAELLAKSVKDEKNRKRATTIVEQVHRVSELIEILMSFSRTEDHAPTRLELPGLLDRALDFYREKLKRRGIEVERHYKSAPQILGDSGRLNQVFLNLFLNAVEAMPEGGTLRVSVDQADQEGAEVRIADTGTGIDSELRARIFEPFFTTKRRVTGRGLGLLVAKTILEEEHAGKIELASDAEAPETEFRIVFPPMR